MAKRRRFGVKVKQPNLPKKKSCGTHIVKIPLGLTVKPNGMAELKFFETLEGYIVNF
jgi:hypothetical protein